MDCNKQNISYLIIFDFQSFILYVNLEFHLNDVAAQWSMPSFHSISWQSERGFFIGQTNAPPIPSDNKMILTCLACWVLNPLDYFLGNLQVKESLTASPVGGCC